MTSPETLSFLEAGAYAKLLTKPSRLQFADFFHNLPQAHKITVNQTGALYFSQACSEDVFISVFQKQNYDSYRFISELMNVFCMAGVHQQPEQSNFLAEGQI